MNVAALTNKPPVWRMISEAIHHLNGKGSYTEIKHYIHSKWENVNDSTINAQLISISVNQPSRIHYPENDKPRITNGSSQYDILYSVGRGNVVLYNPEEHGLWEIYTNELGSFSIRQLVEEITTESFDEGVNTFLFPIEAHLRDFLIKNLSTVKGRKLKVFVNDDGRDGREYPTEVGPIDILTIDETGNFVVFELKLSRGADKAIGQLLRYMGWVKQNLANGKSVEGIIVANKMDTKIKYAVQATTNIKLYEYEMNFRLSEPKN